MEYCDTLTVYGYSIEFQRAPGLKQKKLYRNHEHPVGFWRRHNTHKRYYFIQACVLMVWLPVVKEMNGGNHYSIKFSKTCSVPPKNVFAYFIQWLRACVYKKSALWSTDDLYIVCAHLCTCTYRYIHVLVASHVVSNYVANWTHPESTMCPTNYPLNQFSFVGPPIQVRQSLCGPITLPVHSLHTLYHNYIASNKWDGLGSRYSTLLIYNSSLKIGIK